jgi:hypothetical protein
LLCHRGLNLREDGNHLPSCGQRKIQQQNPLALVLDESYPFIHELSPLESRWHSPFQKLFWKPSVVIFTEIFSLAILRLPVGVL